MVVVVVLLGFTNASDCLIVSNTDNKGFVWHLQYSMVCPHFSGVHIDLWYTIIITA